MFGGPSRKAVAEMWNAAVASDSGSFHPDFYDKLDDESAVKQYFSDALQYRYKSHQLQDQFFQSFSTRSHKIIQESSLDKLQAYITAAYSHAEDEELDTTMWMPFVYRLLVYLTNLDAFDSIADKQDIWRKLIKAGEMDSQGTTIPKGQQQQIIRQLDEAEEIFWKGPQKPGFRAQPDPNWIVFKSELVQKFCLLFDKAPPI
ncbi:hypothetical protein O181_070656 [Austropuccinia psidii MF-1]|uniref:Uncharacterized protein n=1 Tax=Austropuccinia psidii MF-1 TaxID=1389203 RepID=A0A9Q3EZ80_9BASI|nr:hypothetical protein [Austropuccinia psidii MF-1]